MDISARAVSLADRPQWAIWVTSVRMRREDRSSISFFILSQTSAGKTFVRLAMRSRGLNPDCLECSTTSQDAPRNASELVGERDGEDVVKQAAPGVSRAALMFNPDTASSYYVYRRSFEAESRSI